MQQLFAIFTHSFIIWARNFSLVYVVLLGLLLIGLLTPKELAAGSELHLLLLMGSLMLVMAAFLAGWFNMIATAVRRYFEQISKATTPSAADALLENWSLLKFFLSGISLHLLPVIAHFLIAGGLLFLLSLSLYPLIPKVLPIFQKLVATGTFNQAQLLQLPAPQRALIEQFSFGVMKVMLGVMAFNFLVALWPAQVMLYEENIFKAYLQSVMRFFRDPFRFTLIVGLWIGAQFFFLFLPALAGGNVFLGVIIQLSGLMVNIYLIITLFVYVLQTSQRPVCIQEVENEPSEPDSDNESDDDDSKPNPPLF